MSPFRASSLLFVEDYGPRCGSHVNIKLATINEALQEEDEAEEEEEEGAGGTSGFTNGFTSGFASGFTIRPTVVTLDTSDNSHTGDSV